VPCRSLWQTDWAEHSLDGSWNIVCPGPSLERTAKLVDASRPTIAVNAAIRAPVPIMAWCSWDAPTDTVHGQSWRARGVGGSMVDCRTVITQGPLERRWYDWLVRVTGNREPWVVGQRRQDPMPPEWRRGGVDAGPSWLLAVRSAVLRGGATTVRCYGLDLAGEGYAFGAPDPRNRDAPDWAGRWVGEKVMLERTARVLETLDVKLIRVTGDVPPLEP